MRYKTQIRSWLAWYLFDRGNKSPKPALYYPTDGWTADPGEVEHALRSDGIWNETNRGKK